MKIGIFTPLFGDMPRRAVFERVSQEGIQAVELGAGAYPGSAHLNVAELLASASARAELKQDLEDFGLELSAISVHGNPLHPVSTIADAHDRALIDAMELAPLLGVTRINGFSGCPGDGPRAENPNWVTCAWPDEFRDVLDWQWRERVIPYWRERAAELASKGLRFGFEMHPGFVVYNNETLLRLRDAVGAHGQALGANFDPSHLWWQGIDPLAAVRQLGLEGALVHCHAKDMRLEPETSRLNGNLDTKSYGDIVNRSWVFRSVGYGHSVEWWKEFVSVLRAVGYDYVLSIEHEDGLMSAMEGLRKAVSVLQDAIIREEPGPMFWAKD